MSISVDKSVIPMKLSFQTDRSILMAWIESIFRPGYHLPIVYISFYSDRYRYRLINRLFQ